jgi:hypothetical protein
MPKLSGDLAQAGLPLAQVKEAMASIGYGKHAIHELDLWESKRTTENSAGNRDTACPFTLARLRHMPLTCCDEERLLRTEPAHLSAGSHLAGPKSEAR